MLSLFSYGTTLRWTSLWYADQRRHWGFLYLPMWQPFCNKLIHWLTQGKKGNHSLEGGWCPFCRKVYNYENGRFA